MTSFTQDALAAELNFRQSARDAAWEEGKHERDAGGRDARFSRLVADAETKHDPSTGQFTGSGGGGGKPGSSAFLTGTQREFAHRQEKAAQASGYKSHADFLEKSTKAGASGLAAVEASGLTPGAIRDKNPAKRFKTLTTERLEEILSKPGSNFSTVNRSNMRQEIAHRKGDS